MTNSPHIRHLLVQGFRGIEQLDWTPEPRLNVLLGGGYVGKTTILEAIGLLLRPTSSVQLSDSDYWLGDIKSEFKIEATVYLPESVGISQLTRMVYPWEWDGTRACVPATGEDTDRNDPVYVLRFRGTADFEAFYEIVQPDGTSIHLPVSLRRRIGLMWLAGDNVERELRLIYGSGLDRLLSDPTLRARLARKIGQEKIADLLLDEGKENLALLEEAFRENNLPLNLDLGLTGSRRISVGSLIGLTAEQISAQLPLATWGAGTQRLAALQVAAANQKGIPIILVDELERGLEPYRQRTLTSTLLSGQSQSFITTHSPIVLREAVSAAIWYIDSAGTIGQLPGDAVRHVLKDPEAFLSRITVVAEGATEVGFLTELLERSLGLDVDTVGIRVTDAGGNDAAIRIVEGLAKAGLKVGAMVDNDGQHSGRWETIHSELGALAFQWDEGCTEENVLRKVAHENLESFVEDPSGELTGERLRSLQVRLGANDKSWQTLVSKSPGISQTVIEAAIGLVPEEIHEDDKRKQFKKHAQLWFKSLRGGAELARKTIESEVWNELRPVLWPLIDAVSKSVGLEAHDPGRGDV